MSLEAWVGEVPFRGIYVSLTYQPATRQHGFCRLEAKTASTRRCSQRARSQNNLTTSNNLIRLSTLSDKSRCLFQRFSEYFTKPWLQTHRGTCHLDSGTRMTRMVHSKNYSMARWYMFRCTNATAQFHSFTFLASQPSGETSHAVCCGWVVVAASHIFRCATWMRKPLGALEELQS